MISRYDTIFLDRDGTLNPDSGYIAAMEEFELYDFTIPALKKLAQAGNRFCIVTNQSGVARGLIKQDSLDEIHMYLRNLFREHSLPLLGIYVCTDHPDNPTDRRKPGPGMFLEAVRDHTIELEKSIMIGDAGSDMEAGVKLRMDTMLVLTGRGQQTKEQLLNRTQPTYIVDDLIQGAVKLIKGQLS